MHLKYVIFALLEIFVVNSLLLIQKLSRRKPAHRERMIAKNWDLRLISPKNNVDTHQNDLNGQSGWAIQAVRRRFALLLRRMPWAGRSFRSASRATLPK